MYKTAVLYAIVNGVITHQKQQIKKCDITRHDIAKVSPFLIFAVFDV